MWLEKLCAGVICGLAELLTGARAIWRDNKPLARQRIYFGNHTSHGDFVLIWSALPSTLRARTRPVAGADYWDKPGLRGFLIKRVFRGVLIDRTHGDKQHDPLLVMKQALAGGDSLILFPEGTRNMGEGLLRFRAGIYHLAENFPEVELVPVWLENLGRAMPKGSLIPLPLLCTLTFGPVLKFQPGETREAFLDRLRSALLQLAPPHQ
ncbi:MAG: 1-acyl-sn-glycerol-3-phosphate acyltransferase [Rhodocyclaceae bacterium]|nr:1-acyl-sn-glycerol-3-phosphate acyltransferase [Rhodocyclaceae bacterium]MBX3668885.1 1-acyl-sn-glycerol-3-phosphate acyltransferase [Rhodocyclaceae bacterium]